MNLFLLIGNSAGTPIPLSLRARYARARCCTGLQVEWHTSGAASVVVGRDGLSIGPTVARWRSFLCTGNVRMDNRADVARSADCDAEALTDLELVVRLVGRRGIGAIPDILGDFAFALWDDETRTLRVARDAFGVKRLFYRHEAGFVFCSSRAELLADGDEYDIQPLVEMIAQREPSPDRTVYARVCALPPGSTATWKGDSVEVRRYWSADCFEPSTSPATSAEALSDTFRCLFTESVRQRLSGHQNVWAQLSGGLDSSSVVSTAAWLAKQQSVPHGVAGTISWVYRWSTDGDEREYSDAVIQQYGIRNQIMRDDWLWKEDDCQPPLTDEPEVEYPLYARERRTCRLIREAGGSVLLTGMGSDHYLTGSMFFFADWLATGRVLEAAREMLRRAALGRTSFWNLAYQNAVLPLLPATLQRWLIPDTALPAWLRQDAARRFGIGETAIGRHYAGRAGHKYATVVREQVRVIPWSLQRNLVFEDELDVRHPFLYRPLVEFGLGLPPEMCTQPNARKWILRQAMQGILPEMVRTRVGKGANPGCAVQSLVHERRRLKSMLTRSVLADLGCIEPGRLSAAFETACQTGEESLATAVVLPLALETWLQVRSGRRTAEVQPDVARDCRHVGT